MANSELRIVEVPGLGDTRGRQHDAHTLVTLESYLNTHEELKDKIPNVVLIFNKFYENRYDGESSLFSQMLRGFGAFRKRITDEKYSNVIFVLTHVASLRKSDQKSPNSRIQSFKSVIERYCSFPKPTTVVLAENRGDDQGLAMVNGYWILPNNELYPKNLIDQIALVTEKGGDLMGNMIFQSVFKNVEQVAETCVRFKKANRSSKVEYYRSVLSNYSPDGRVKDLCE